ncbi:hypothetical protein CUMW_124380 [Citrus unshiu]|nr:hypothetical protein CUMW_124380 [Citrus unshiu]
MLQRRITATIAGNSNTSKELLLKLNISLANLSRSGHYQDALHLFVQIHSSHKLKPDFYSLSTTLAACANLRNAAFGNQLHSYALRAGLKAYPHVANTILSLYKNARDLVSVKRVFSEIQNPDVYSWTTFLSACTKMGHVDYACEVFDKMPDRDLPVYNAMITGCTENGYEDIGIGLFREMHKLDVRRDNYSFASVLSVCDAGLLEFGRQLHSLVTKSGLSCLVSVVNALITMYFNCGNVVDACKVFEEAKGYVCNHISYNVMMDGLASVGRVEEALIRFRDMLVASLRPSELTFVSVMSACLCPRVGYQVHAQAIKSGFEAYTSVSNAAITMYSSCGKIDEACMIFARLQEKDIVSWNTMISTYAQRNLGRSAILAYLEMQSVGIRPDEFTFGSLLASSGFIEMVEMIHAFVFINGIITNIQVSNALISAYAKNERIKQAYQIFHNMPDEYTLSVALSSCARISSLRHGKQIHGYVLKNNLISKMSLGNAMITLYAKCGDLDCSLRVFNMMIEKDTISWNALISAYAQHGEGKEAVGCFKAMQDVGRIKPDQATFTAVLSACSHAGLVDNGTRIFDSMVNDYGFIPAEDHLSCMLDLLGRAGYLDEAERVINSQHIQARSDNWWALFSACAAHGNLRLGRIIAGLLLEREQDKPSVYVLLSNIYAAAGLWEEAANIRELLKRTGVMKQPGCSWIGS